MKFKDKFIRFMSGRYGSDALNMALLIFGLLISLVSTFVRNVVVSGVIFGVCVLIMGLIIFRTMSRRIDKRRKENAVFLKIWNPIAQFFVLTYHRIRYVKSYRYRKCPHCKAQLRFPNQKGKHTVRCPRCQGSFEVKI